MCIQVILVSLTCIIIFLKLRLDNLQTTLMDIEHLKLSSTAVISEAPRENSGESKSGY